MLVLLFLTQFLILFITIKSIKFVIKVFIKNNIQ